MAGEKDILIKNAQLRHRPIGELVALLVKGGRIAALGTNLNPESGQTIIDAAGGLVTESFVNPHLHLDKVYTLDRMDELALQSYQGEGMGKAMNAIELASRVKTEYDERWILPNVRKALDLAVMNGNTHIRAFADVDNKAKLIGVEALLKAKKEFQGRVSVQVVAFAQDGIIREPGAESLLRQAMQMGADVVGGIPWIEFTEADARRHVSTVFAIAKEFEKPVSMLVDDAGDAGLRTLEMMAVETIAQGWHGRALAHHARAMALYPKPYLQKVIALLKQAEMYVVTDPQTGPLHARVKEILEEGAYVCLGQDDISDAYYPFGQNNMLEVAFLASHLLWMTSAAEMDILYDMITSEAAKAVGLEDYGLIVGTTANLVVLDEVTVREALRYHRQPKCVISHGALLEN
jgi:cytosine/creatinine deaminase